MPDSVWAHRWQPTRLPVPGILQARTLEWVAISFSNAWKWKVKVKSLSRVQLCATPQTAAHRAPLFLGFSRQEHRSGLPFPSSMHETNSIKSPFTSKITPPCRNNRKNQVYKFQRNQHIRYDTRHKVFFMKLFNLTIRICRETSSHYCFS